LFTGFERAYYIGVGGLGGEWKELKE